MDESPFLTAGAAARLARVSDVSFVRALGAGRFPGYRIGGRWFVPAGELRTHLAPHSTANAVELRELIDSLLVDLPDVADIRCLEAFFGMRRPHLYAVLRSFPLQRGEGGVPAVARAQVAHVLGDTRNRARPLRPLSGWDRTPRTMSGALTAATPQR